tara:strand:+ start:111 stop:881 length:771 start_codon:yes stop_codon:yes gene_type:complete
MLSASAPLYATTYDSNSPLYDFVYVTEWGTTDVGVSAARWRISENQFFMTGEFNASGLTRLVADFAGYVSITAKRDKESWRGQQLVIASNWGGETSLAETKWSEDGHIAKTVANPAPDLNEVHPVDAEMRIGVTDPFSAMMTMLERLDAGKSCSGIFQIYDGRRRAELSFSDLGTEELASDRDFAFNGKAQICGIVSRPLGGHRRKSRFITQKSNPNKTRVFIVRFGPGLMVPVRIEVDLFFGRIVTRLDINQSVF